MGFFEYKNFVDDYSCPVIDCEGATISRVGLHKNFDIVYPADLNVGSTNLGRARDFPGTLSKFGDGQLSQLAILMNKRPMKSQINTNDLRRIRDLELELERKNSEYRVRK